MSGSVVGVGSTIVNETEEFAPSMDLSIKRLMNIP